ncbi:O-antigen ligase family protein, partial [Planctomycetota bacterium]
MIANERLLHNGTAVLAVGVVAVVTAVDPLIGVLCAVMLLAMIASLKWLPLLGVLVLIGFVPMDSLHNIRGIDESLSLTKVVFPVAFAFLIWQKSVSRKDLVLGVQGKLMLCFAGALFLSASINGLSFDTVNSLRRYLSVFLLTILVGNTLDSEKSLKYLAAVIILTCLVSSIVGLYEHFLAGQTLMPPNEEALRQVGRTSGLSTYSPNDFGARILFGFFPMMYLAFVAKRLIFRVALLVAGAVMVMSIFFSLSRGTSIVIVLCLPYLLYKLRTRISPWKILVPILIMVLCVLPFIPMEYYERMESLISQSSTYDWTLQRRIGYHVIGLDLLAKSPVWGVGPGTFPLHYTAQEYRYISTGFMGRRPLHNIYLAIACQVGLLGLTFFLLTLLYTFRSLRFVANSYREGEQDSFLKIWAEAFEVGFVALLLASVLLPNEYSKYLW